MASDAMKFRTKCCWDRCGRDGGRFPAFLAASFLVSLLISFSVSLLVSILVSASVVSGCPTKRLQAKLKDDYQPPEM